MVRTEERVSRNSPFEICDFCVPRNLHTHTPARRALLHNEYILPCARARWGRLAAFTLRDRGSE